MNEPSKLEVCKTCGGVGTVKVILDKTCAECGEAFATQGDRTGSRTRTKGVIYCSRSCANAASQAKYRKRQRELKRKQAQAQEDK